MARIFQRLTPQVAANPVKLVIEWQKVVERLEEEIARIGATTADLTFNNSGAGGASGTVFNGGTAKTVSYNTIGAQPAGSYLTGNQTITFSGDATGSGSTSVTLTIPAGTVTYAKMQDVSAASKLLGRGDSGSGDVQEITLGSGLTMTGTTLSASGGGSGLSDGDYGDVTVSSGGTVINIDAGAVGTTELADDAVTAAKLADTAVTPGSYTNASITVDQQGRLTSASSGSGVPQRTILQRSTSQSIANNADADVSWDTTAVQDDVSAFSSGSPTIVTVPSGKAYVRVTIRSNWASNGSGARFTKLYQNGSTLLENFIYQAAFESSNQWITRWYSVTAGDTLKVVVRQQSGGALNFAGNAASYGNPYVQFEWA